MPCSPQAPRSAPGLAAAAMAHCGSGVPPPPTDGPIALQAPRTAPQQRGGRRMGE